MDIEEKKKLQAERARKNRRENPEKYREILRRSQKKHYARRHAENLQWRKEHPENCKRHYLRRTITKMGLTPEEFDEKLSEQNGVCAICGGVNSSGKRLFIDHNHNTGAIRGLLCCRCNTGIGNFLENKELLNSAISYLMEWENCLEKIETNWPGETPGLL